MPEEEVRVVITGESVGEEAYETHAAGLENVRDSADKAKTSMDDYGESTRSSSRSGLMMVSTSSRLVSVMSSMGFVSRDVSMGINLLTGSYRAMALASRLVGSSAWTAASGLWAQATAALASSTWLAPVLVAVIAGALGTMAGLKLAGALGTGGYVPHAGIYMLAEKEPEYVIPESKMGTAMMAAPAMATIGTQESPSQSVTHETNITNININQPMTDAKELVRLINDTRDRYT